MSSASDPGQPTSGPNTTLRTSVTGIAAGLVTLGTAGFVLLTGRHLSAEQTALLLTLPAAIGSICGNVGSLLAKGAARRSVQSLATATAEHVLTATGSPVAAGLVLESVGVAPAEPAEGATS